MRERPSWPPWFPRAETRGTTRTLTFAVAAAALLLLAAVGVRAALFATADGGPTTVASGTLLLDLAADGDGLDASLDGLAPGDTVDRFVDLTNTGTLAAGDLTVALQATGDPVLLVDGAAPATTRALTLTVDGCTTAWDTTASSCAGSEDALLAATTLGDLVGEPQPLASTFDAGDTVHLRLRLTLPDQDETSTNGVLPDPTVQDASAQVTVTFRAEQRDATSTAG